MPVQYVDGYVLPIPKKNVPAYRRLAKTMSKVFIKHGALEFRESVGDDLAVGFGLPFPKVIKLKAGETIIFSWIAYKSRAHRDRVNAAVMKDPACACMPDKMPFDPSRMLVGGFKVIVSA